jgi:hypothetical protein
MGCRRCIFGCVCPIPSRRILKLGCQYFTIRSRYVLLVRLIFGIVLFDVIKIHDKELLKVVPGEKNEDTAITENIF